MEGLDWLEVQLLETLQLRMLSETLALPAIAGFFSLRRSLRLGGAVELPPLP